MVSGLEKTRGILSVSAEACCRATEFVTLIQDT